MPVAQPKGPRRDARENRRAIVDVARALFAESADVAMCQVARRAGVGQGTLYRNFPSRAALVAEILDDQVERIAALAAEQSGKPGAFHALLRALIDGTGNLYGVGILARGDTATDAQLARSRRRIIELIGQPLRDAKDARILRPDISEDDVFLLLAMVRGGMEGPTPATERSAVADRTLELLFHGLKEPAARGGT